MNATDILQAILHARDSGEDPSLILDENSPLVDAARAAIATTAKPVAVEGVPSGWDASKIIQPGWNHVQQAFIDGAREARANPEAGDAEFALASDGYTKRVFECVDPVSEEALRTESWYTPPAAREAPRDELLPKLLDIPTNWEISWGNLDDEESPSVWRVHECSGGRNDREWQLIGHGETVGGALEMARKAARLEAARLVIKLVNDSSKTKSN